MWDLSACITHLLGENTSWRSLRGGPLLSYVCLNNSQHVLTLYTEIIEGFLEYVSPHPFLSLFFPSCASIDSSSACPPGLAGICFSIMWSVRIKKFVCLKRPNYYLKRVPRSEYLHVVSRCVCKYQVFFEKGWNNLQIQW